MPTTIRADDAERERAIRRTLLEILALNLLVAGGKGAVGLAFGSLAVVSDALHSLLDSASNVVGLFAMRFAHQPPDREHPYGHGKAEIIAAMIIGLLIGAAALGVAARAISALARGAQLHTVTNLELVIMFGTLAVNIFVAIYERWQGHRLDSQLLVADAAHTASDVLVSTGVIIALFLTRGGVALADPIASLAVVLVIGRVGLSIVMHNANVLLDRAAIDAERVRSIVTAVPGVEGCHRIRSRGLANVIQLDLHLVLDGDATLREAHALSHEVETRLRRELPSIKDVTIHLEPDGEPEEEL